MCSLKRQIRAVEKDIELNNQIIKHENALLLHYICNKQLLVIGLLGSFFTGYVFARKKSFMQLTRLSLRLAFKAEKFYNNMKLVLPLIKM